MTEEIESTTNLEQILLNDETIQKRVPGWVREWVGAWMEVKTALKAAYSNQSKTVD